MAYNTAALVTRRSVPFQYLVKPSSVDNMAVMEEVSHVDDVNRPLDTQSELGVGKGAHPDDNILLAQGHAPILKRSFNFLGTLGLGFRYGAIIHPISSHSCADRGLSQYYEFLVVIRQLFWPEYALRRATSYSLWPYCRLCRAVAHRSWSCRGSIRIPVIWRCVTLSRPRYCALIRSGQGQYHFTYIVAPEKYKRLAAYCVGVLSIIGWWVITCSGISNNVQSIIGMVQFAHPSYEHHLWHSYLLYLAVISISRKSLRSGKPYEV